jgi:hypothetical protein
MVIVTMGYTHTNLDSKVAAVGKLSGECHRLAANSRNTLELETEEWVSG